MVKQVAAQQAKTNVVTTAGKGSVLQRQCICGNHTIAGGECVECKKSKQKIFRKANHHTQPRRISDCPDQAVNHSRNRCSSSWNCASSMTSRACGCTRIRRQRLPPDRSARSPTPLVR